VKILENEKSSVKSAKIDNWIKLPKGSKDIGMMKPTIKLSKLSPEVIFWGSMSRFYFVYSSLIILSLI